LRTLARLVADYPRWVLLAWLVVFVVSLPFAARLPEVLVGQPEVPEGGVASSVTETLATEFAVAAVDTLVAVVRPVGTQRPGGAGNPVAGGRTAPTFEVADPEYGAAVTRLADDLRALPGVVDVRDHSSAPGLDLLNEADGYSMLLIGLEPTQLSQAKGKVAAVRSSLEQASGLTFALSGGAATVVELESVSQRDARRAEVYGLPIALVILVVAFGAIVAAGLPLLCAVTTISVSAAALFWLGQLVPFAVFTGTIVTMLGLATGIDYALLIVSRFREELRADPDARAAAARTTLGAGRAVAFSGLTVMLALAALLIPPVAFIRSIGIGTMVVLLVSVLVAITAVPATLALLGHRVNWLRVTRREPGLRSRAFWFTKAVQIMKRSVLWTVVGTAVLAVLAVPALRMQVADPGARGLTQASEARQVVDALAGLGLDGLLSPFDVVIDFGEQGFYHPSNVRAVSLLSRDVGAVDAVQTITSPLSLDSVPRLFLYQYYASRELALASEIAPLARATVSEDGRYVLVRVVPDGALTPADGGAIHAALTASLSDLGLSGRIGGGYVRGAEWTEVLYRSFPLALAVVGLATMVLLGLAFRSVLIPLKAVALNVLTVGAAFGVLTLVMQDGWVSRLLGTGPVLGYIDTSAPLFIFAIVFGLSMDYEVFLVARIREAHVAGLSDHDAVASALAATGGVITSAAAVMVTVFALFLFSHVELIRMLGLGLTVAVILDATLVRLALVPALMTLAGRWNWWLPGPLRRLARYADRVRE
jgi:RND superfamily putative drug exporter